MQNTWRNKVFLLAIGIQFLSVSSSADEKGTVDKPNGRCINLLYRGWQIVQRLDKGVYEVVTREGGRHCWTVPDTPVWHNPAPQCMDTPTLRAVLITSDDKFQSAGVIRSSLWVLDSDKNPEMKEMALENGFKQKYRVVRESAECEVYGVQQAKLQEEKRKQDEVISRKLASQRNAEELKQERKRKAQQKEEQAEKEKAEALWK